MSRAEPLYIELPQGSHKVYSAPQDWGGGQVESFSALGLKSLVFATPVSISLPPLLLLH